MDILEELRDLDKIFYEYEADDGALLDRAANEIEELRKERNELREESKVDWVVFQKAAEEIERLREALHRISLGSQDSGTTKESLGKEARAAVKEKE